MQNKRLLHIFSFVFWVAIWQVVAASVGKPLLLPSPHEVALRLFELVQTAQLWRAIALSLSKIMAGFLLAMACGAVLAVLSARFEWAEAIFSMPMRVVSATPVASFIILALVWIKTWKLPIFIVFLMVLPLVYNNILGGIKSADKKLLEMARVYRFSKWQTAVNIYLPATAPALIAAAKTGLAFAWKAGIAAEVLALPKGAIGTFLYNSKIELATTDLFAWTVIIISLSIVLENLLGALTKLALKHSRFQTESEAKK